MFRNCEWSYQSYVLRDADEQRRRIDALVHIFYKIAGTAGAFCTALALMQLKLQNYADLFHSSLFYLVFHRRAETP